ncbi:Metalloenzyme, LuxS/M16 peptidase-like protein [Chytridium lagenaria]|nr:Metalloenzyme, LuxS/M16 peptidase-like protein [Chytridium lagenaria]
MPTVNSAHPMPQSIPSASASSPSPPSEASSHLNHHASSSSLSPSPANRPPASASHPASLSEPDSIMLTTRLATHKVFTDITKPDLDDRTYRLLSLANGLDCLVVSDPTTDRSSAALDVHVGYFSDPDDVEGLAHFLEHLLFLGTEKYPVENDYSQFLSEVGGGYSNAFTSSEHTNFFFEVSSEGEAFEGALDRFAQFFIAPLFDESCTERELKAVDSEHKKNIQDDSWRISQLEKDLSSSEHPYKKFGTGSWETLHELPLKKGLDIRKILLDFHDRYYSANIMKLVVLGKEPVDVLSEWVVSKFSPVHNKNIPIPAFPGHPLTDKELMKLIRVKPVKDMQSLDITFPFPDTVPFYRKSPDSYLAHLLGHEAPGSVLALLRAKGWANGLGCSVAHAGIHFDFFKISIELTDDGMVHWQSIVIIIFQYIDLLKKNGVQNWIYDECKTMAKLTFRFQEKFSASDFTSWASQNMQAYDKADILSGYSLMEEFDEDLIRSLLDLLKPDRFRVMLVSTQHEAEHWEKAPWYGTEYVIEDLPPSLLETISNPSLMKNFAYLNGILTYQRTLKSLRQQYQRLWYKCDQTFKVPEHNLLFSFELQTHTLALGQLAGLYYSLSTLVEGFELRVAGYTDKISVLLGKVVHTMRKLEIVPERFSAIKEETVRHYKNFDNENPDHHASYFMNWILQEKLWTNSEKLQEIESITAEEVSEFARIALQQLHIEGFVMGTVAQDEGVSYLKIVEDGLTLREIPTRPLPITLRFSLLRTHVIPYPTIHSSIPTSISDTSLKRSCNVHGCSLGATETLKENNHTVVGYTYRRSSPTTTTLTMRSNITSKSVMPLTTTSEHAFYSSISWRPNLALISLGQKSNLVMLCGVEFESERDPAYVEQRIEVFIVKLRQIIDEMPEEEYQRNVDTLAAKLLQTDKNQNEAVDRLWGAIKYSGYQFYKGRQDAVNIRKVTRSDLLAFFDERIEKSGILRAKLSVQIWSDHSMKEWKQAQEAVANGSANVNAAVDSDTAVAAVGEVVAHAAADDHVVPAVADVSPVAVVNDAVACDGAFKKDEASEILLPRSLDLVFETDEAVSELKGTWLLSRGVVPASIYSHLAKAAAVNV